MVSYPFLCQPDVYKRQVYAFYQDFLAAQAARGREVTPPGNSFDVYDLAALAYIYKRIKETDPVREASHVAVSYTHLDVYKRQL